MNPGLLSFVRSGGGSVADLISPLTVFLVVALLFALLLYIKERVGRHQAQERLDALKLELKSVLSRAEKHEYRIERFELLWFPTVTASAQTKEILAVAPGMPHCKACAIPLGFDRDLWTCRQCGAQHPTTLADLMVTDTIGKQALKFFQERHPGYRIPKA